MKVNAIDDSEVFGVLARNVPTRLLDISRSGCLLESRQRVETGTVGELRLEVGREVFVDDVRVTRCVLVEGSGSSYLVGAEFVQTRRPGEQSIRRAVADILRELVEGGGRVAASVRKGGEAAAAPAIVNAVRSTREEVS